MLFLLFVILTAFSGMAAAIRVDGLGWSCVPENMRHVPMPPPMYGAHCVEDVQDLGIKRITKMVPGLFVRVAARMTPQGKVRWIFSTFRDYNAGNVVPRASLKHYTVIQIFNEILTGQPSKSPTFMGDILNVQRNECHFFIVADKEYIRGATGCGIVHIASHVNNSIDPNLWIPMEHKFEIREISEQEELPLYLSGEEIDELDDGIVIETVSGAMFKIYSAKRAFFPVHALYDRACWSSVRNSRCRDAIHTLACFVEEDDPEKMYKAATSCASEDGTTLHDYLSDRWRELIAE